MCVNTWAHLQLGKACERKTKGHGREDRFFWQQFQTGEWWENLFFELVIWLWCKQKGLIVFSVCLFVCSPLSPQLPSCLTGNSKRFLENDTTGKSVEQNNYTRVITTFSLEFPVLLAWSPAFPMLCCFPFSSHRFPNSFWVAGGKFLKSWSLKRTLVTKFSTHIGICCLEWKPWFSLLHALLLLDLLKHCLTQLSKQAPSASEICEFSLSGYLDIESLHLSVMRNGWSCWEKSATCLGFCWSALKFRTVPCAILTSKHESLWWLELSHK